MDKVVKKVICVVDDDPIFHYVCKVNFMSLCPNFEFMSFFDGQQAYDYYNDQAEENYALPDILLVDINMPRMNGWELVDRLSKRRLLHNTKLYIVSSSILPEDSFRSLSKNEVTSYLTKPLLKENFVMICENENEKNET